MDRFDGRESCYEWPPNRFMAEAGGDWKREGRDWRGRCPACGGAMTLRGGGRGTVAKCWSDCTSAEVAHVVNPPPSPGSGPPPRIDPETLRKRKAKAEADRARRERRERIEMDRRKAKARDRWAAALPVAVDPASPPERWCVVKPRRHPLRLPGVAWPPSVRWLPKDRHPEPHRARWLPDGGGMLVAALMPVGAWCAGAPVDPEGVALVYVGPDGEPLIAPDLGRNKRSRGACAGKVCAVAVGDASAPVLLCEGLADALHLAARHPGASVLTPIGKPPPSLAEPLYRLRRRVILHPDGDTEGRQAAVKLRAALKRLAARPLAHPADVRIEHRPDGVDPADADAPLPTAPPVVNNGRRPPGIPASETSVEGELRDAPTVAVLDALAGGPKAAGEVAAQTGIDRERVRVLLGVQKAAGAVRFDAGLWELTGTEGDAGSPGDDLWFL